MRKQQNTKQKIKAIKKLFENTRDTFSRNKINEIRTNLYKKELIYDFLKKKPKLKGNERRVFNNIVKYFDGLYSDLSKENKYRENFLYGLEQLFNEDLYYKPIEVKSAFNGNYVLYESIGDEYRSLSVLQYLLDIKPYLYDLIEEYSYNDSWKIQLNMRVSFPSLTDSTVRQTLYSNKVDSLHYHFHKVTLKRGSSVIALPDWVNHKRSTINPHNINDNNCFLYCIVATLIDQSIPSNPERMWNYF